MELGTKSAGNANDIKIMEFIQDLKEAIQNGNFQQQQQQQQLSQFDALEQQSSSAAFISANLNLTNVNNLSNQTFSYIISWLKQQQQQQASDEAKWQSNGGGCDPAEAKQVDASDEIKMLKSQLCMNEREKDKLFNQLKEFQVENLELKTKLINLSSISTTSLTLQSNYFNNSVARAKMLANAKPIISDTDKDYEIDRLRRMIDDLIKSNEEKDKKIDELTKQVIRFKRIQEIVLSAQNPLASKHKNLGEFDLDSCADGSGSNNYAVINTAAMFDDPLAYGGGGGGSLTRNGGVGKMKQPPPPAPPAASIPATPTHEASNGAGQQHQQQPAPHQGMGSSSLSSSMSSSSSNSSTSSSSSSSTIQPNQSQQQSLSGNSAGLSAPLATISELAGYNSSSNTNISLSNTSTSTVTISNPAPAALLSNGSAKHNSNGHNSNGHSSNGHSNNGQINIVMSAATNSDQGAAKKPTGNASGTNLSNLVGSINAFNGNAELAAGKSKAFSLNTGNKYTSVGSINLKNSSFLASQNQQQQQQRSSEEPALATTDSSKAIKDGNGKGLRNFFGKLIRTSLVNINDSSLHHQQLIANSSSNKNVLTLNAPSINDALNCTTNNGVGGLFKRGGKRATANARLQNFSFSNSALVANSSKPNDTQIEKFLAKQISLNAPSGGGGGSGASPSATIDTLTFAKLPSDKVYEWLRKNGFEGYFPCAADGTCSNKWIKNGLHLLQASQSDYEKELGIKNPLHRKRLSLLLQALYTNHALVNTPEHYFINYVDHHWVIKWLDDIGLPQYKDIFNEAKIDGRMLYHLNSEDIHNLSIHSELHYLSIKRAIHVLRLNNFDTQCLRRRPSGDERLDKSEVMLWTNHRIMEWLRSIDLSEYAPNLRGSGVHGGLMMFEPRFNSTVLADILSIPSSKTLLRRHLNTLFIDLIGLQMQQSKKDAESQPGYQPLNAATKLKHTKRSIGLFSHKRTKSQDSKDLLISAAAAAAAAGTTLTSPTHHLQSTVPVKSHYSTLPSNGGGGGLSERDVITYGNTKLTFMNMGPGGGTAVIQDNVPTSFV